MREHLFSLILFGVFKKYYLKGVHFPYTLGMYGKTCEPLKIGFSTWRMMFNDANIRAVPERSDVHCIIYTHNLILDALLFTHIQLKSLLLSSSPYHIIIQF